MFGSFATGRIIVNHGLHIPRILVFASGSATGGGSGFRELVEFSRTNPPVLQAKIVGVVSNHENGGVRAIAEELGVKFFCLDDEFTALNYQGLLDHFGAEWAMLSGWLKPVRGLDPRTTINIHPGPLPQFGGKGMCARPASRYPFCVLSACQQHAVIHLDALRAVFAQDVAAF